MQAVEGTAAIEDTARATSDVRYSLRMAADEMNLSRSIEDAIAAARARVRVGYPWWLRPWLARDVIGITLGRRIYLSTRIDRYSEEAFGRLMRHELAHVEQVNRLGLFVFLWRYAGEFLRHLWRERSVSRAYRMISFEVEAAAAERTLQ